VLYLELARRARGLTQRQLGRATDIRQPDLSLMERHALRPTPAQAQRLAHVLDVPAELLSREVKLARPEIERAESLAVTA
jgi:transcriptional regulator with XRE-family HTH domain